MKTPRLLALASALILFMVSPLLHAQTYTDMHDFNNSDGCCASYPSLLAEGEDGDIVRGHHIGWYRRGKHLHDYANRNLQKFV